MKEIIFYKKENGTIPVKEFLDEISVLNPKLFKKTMSEYTFEQYEKETFSNNPKLKEICEQEMRNYLIAQRIKKSREKKGISQLELAKLTNTTQSVVARIEAGNQNLSINTLSRFLKILNLELKIDDLKLV